MQTIYKLIASELRVPISILVGHVLRRWLIANADNLLSNQRKRIEFGEYLVDMYLKKRRN